MRLKNLMATLLLLGALLGLAAPANAVAVTVTNISRTTTLSINGIAGPPMVIIIGTYDLDSSYPTGGEAFSVSTYLPGGVLWAQFQPKSGYVFNWTGTATNLVMAYYADYDAVADGALIQVPNTTNLSTVTGIPFIAFGYGYY